MAILSSASRSRSDLRADSSDLGHPRVVAFSPPCLLELEGSGTACEILELSAEGVNIAIRSGRAIHIGQHGRLLIGPPEGDHYELPVDVSWVEPSASTAVLGLAIPSAHRWRFSRP